MRISLLSQLGIILAVLSAGNADAAGDSTAKLPFMATAGKTSQPVGHFEFCRNRPADCAVVSREPVRVELTPAHWEELVDVNDMVNRTITPVTDEELFGKAEVWTFPVDGKGDCEDFALLKQRMLIARGWPAGALSITVVRQKNGDGHAVLTALTDRGDLILDMLEPRILLWSATDYSFIKRQSETNTGQWVAIEDDRTPLVGSLER